MPDWKYNFFVGTQGARGWVGREGRKLDATGALQRVQRRHSLEPPPPPRVPSLLRLGLLQLSTFWNPGLLLSPLEVQVAGWCD